jgi:hypothetical protein
VEGNDLRAAECLTRRVPADPVQTDRLYVVAAAELRYDPRRDGGRSDHPNDTSPTELVF